MQKQRLIVLVIGILLAAAAVVMIDLYIKQRTKTAEQELEKIRKQAAAQAQPQGNLVGVLVATKDIPRGGSIGPESVQQQGIPELFVQPKAVGSIERIAGMITLAPITAGEQVTLTKLAYPKQAGGLAEVTPAGKRAITITVDNISSLIGMLKPGDYVDVFVLLSIPVKLPDGKEINDVKVIPLFQNVLVLAIGQDIGAPVAVSEGDAGRYTQPQPTPPEGSTVITLALGPQEAALISYVQEQGKIRLVLRSPADSKIELVPPTGWETLFQHLMPSGMDIQQQEKPAEPVPSSYVDVYRGTNKERVPIYK